MGCKEGYLCVMLDCSRNAIMSISGVKSFIDKISAMGYNALQLYTEDTYEIIQEPLFGYMRGRYTQKELKEIDAYAKNKGIELIPCIQTLGHLDQLFSWQRFQRVQDIYNILLVGEEETYQLIEQMFVTCAECFTSRNINIGMDEAHMLGLGRYLDKHGYHKRSDILLTHLKRVCEIAKKYGFKPMMWSDMFFKIGTEICDNADSCVVRQETIEKVPENVQLIYWDYYSTDKEHYKKWIQKHNKFQRNIWFAGCAKAGRNYNASNEFFMRSLASSIPACKETGLKNIIITIWGDYGNECPTATTLPTLAFVASIYYNKDHKKLFESVTGEIFDDFIKMDMKMPEGFPKDEEFSTGAKTMLYSDCFLGRYDSMVYGDGREKREFEKKAKEFDECKNRSKNYKYLFDFYARLCDVLSIKYDLGYFTRLYYKSGNKIQIKRLLYDYERLIPRFEKFIESARIAWYVENKPHGFDIVELRLGGALQRIKSCYKRLNDWLSGATKNIPELEEILVRDNSESALSGKMTDVGNWPFIATVNRV